ncbi:MAG: PilZ domain-containing protein [Candidatus Xenobia bacterium]
MNAAVREQRREVRVPAELDGGWLVHSPNRQEPFRLQNVSVRGAALTRLRQPLRPYSEYVLVLAETPFRVRCCWSRPSRYQSGFAAGCVVVDADHGRPWSQSWADFLKDHCDIDVVNTRQRRADIRIQRPYRVRLKTSQGLQVGWTRNFCRLGASLALPGDVPAGSTGTLTLRLHPAAIEGGVEVVRSSPQPDGSWAVAVRFTALAPASETVLVRLIARLKQDWAEGSSD